MIENYIKAGKIVKDVRELALKKVHEGMKVLDLINLIEGEIIKRGALPAFPCNISINEITAHYTSPPNDLTLINGGDLVKIDLGAHVDGFIADSAISVSVEGDDPAGKMGPYKPQIQEEMIDTAKEALNTAISTIKPGVEVGKIGEEVEKTIHSRGLKPVSNLTGHSMEQWILHSGLSIPNVKEKNHHKLEEGDVLAIEPFVTDGVGIVSDMKDAFIFRFLRDRPVRMIQARRILEKIKTEYKILPFAQRWLEDKNQSSKSSIALRQLISSRAVYPYHVLREKSGARVAQAEHTVIIESDGCLVITE
ncbi:MAG TPA: type II methionyl aminopeptidase [Methanobacteriaceae archaeon]|nr:type II methionyl aminopeptidase [Methanobacteriaceae archaeon]HNS24791.1 type II methionyl aminopeptidase [Methanobacteriaceae archaeon]